MVTRTGSFAFSFGKIKMLPLSSQRQATLRQSVVFNCSIPVRLYYDKNLSQK